MSTYVTVQGWITFPTKEAFWKAVMQLQPRLLDAQGHFLREDNSRVTDEPNIDVKSLTIDIPFCHYRNFDPTLLHCPGIGCQIVTTCTDGCFQGTVDTNGVVKLYELQEWAAENIDEDDGKPPVLEEYLDEDDYWQNYADWQSLVESEFFQEYE